MGATLGTKASQERDGERQTRVGPHAPADGWSIFDLLICSISVVLLAIPSDGSQSNAWFKQVGVRVPAYHCC